MNWVQEMNRCVGPVVDLLYKDAVRLVRASQEFRVELLQRTFRIGYNRASRLLEQLIAESVVAEFPDPSGGYFKALP